MEGSGELDAAIRLFVFKLVSQKCGSLFYAVELPCHALKTVRFQVIQSFMMELWRHIGADLDVPAGDIGVGGREIGYLFGMYKKLANEFSGVLTGKGLSYGGSLIRPEATGYGLVYFAREMLATKGKSFNGATVAISGSGNVAQFACEKVLDLGGKPVTMSDSSGFIYDAAGIDREKLAWIMDLKNKKIHISNNNRPHHHYILQTYELLFVHPLCNNNDQYLKQKVNV